MLYYCPNEVSTMHWMLLRSHSGYSTLTSHEPQIFRNTMAVILLTLQSQLHGTGLACTQSRKRDLDGNDRL